MDSKEIIKGTVNNPRYTILAIKVKWFNPLKDSVCLPKDSKKEKIKAIINAVSKQEASGLSKLDGEFYQKLYQFFYRLFQDRKVEVVFPNSLFEMSIKSIPNTKTLQENNRSRFQ